MRHLPSLPSVRPASRAWPALAALALAFAGLAPASRAATGEDFPHTFTRVGEEFRLTMAPAVGYYFGFQYTDDLTRPFGTVEMAFGDPGPTFVHVPMPGENAFFLRAEAISVFGPRDSDGDGLDDLWEIGRAYLDPLDPTDAAKPSPNVAGISNLDEYRARFGLSSAKPQFYSREVSAFNFGAPSALFEAISREQSVFNFGGAFGSLDALSREVSVFNGERVPIAGYPESYSREVSVYNFGAPPFATEALSREVSVFNGEGGPAIAGYPESYSREVSVFNHGAPTASVEVISREVSVFNNIE
jgi:hypothetical protein